MGGSSQESYKARFKNLVMIEVPIKWNCRPDLRSRLKFPFLDLRQIISDKTL